MKYIKNITWEEVFNGWRNREANNPEWIKCARSKGWPDWESWRRFSAEKINAENLQWKLYEFTDPQNEIPAMLMGPYTGWQSRVKEKNVFTFNDLIKLPEQFEYWRTVSKIISIIENFPFPTEFIGLIREDNKKIVCVEGHHRATAVAIAKHQNIKIDFKGYPTIALANLQKISILDEILQRGTLKNTES